MLLYRPLLAAYHQTDAPAVHRYILRELSDPTLHAEPDELLTDLEANRSITVTGEPARLVAEVSLRERHARLQLTTRDEARKLGGLWTGVTESRERASWAVSMVPTGVLGRAAGVMLGRVPVSLVQGSDGRERALALSVLGNFGADVALETLTAELQKGPLGPAAALGLSQIEPAAAEAVLIPAVQTQGLRSAAGWLGVALSHVANDHTLPLLLRMARAKEPEVREQAAWAVGFFRTVDVSGVIDLLTGEPDPFVRLNLVRSLGRLGVPGGRQTLRRFHMPSDPEILKVAVIRAAGRSNATEMTPFLERTVKNGSPEELAEALQALVCLGVPGHAFIPAARQAVKSRHPRAMLTGLLALAIWAPDEAFARVVQIFSQKPGAHWFLAVYVLRYLRCAQTVPLLVRLTKGASGTDLEEFAVSALCRYLDEPEAIRTLLAIAREGPSAAVTRRMMQDLARHLPESQRVDVAGQIRTLLRPDLDPAVANPILMALGSLGTPADLSVLASFVRGRTAASAVRAIELLAVPSAEELLEQIAAGNDPGAAVTAVVALFRRGSPSAAVHLQRMSASPDERSAGVAALFEIGLSIRLVKVVSSLAPLATVLDQRAKSLPEPSVHKAAPTGGYEVVPARQGLDFLRVLTKAGKAEIAEVVLPPVAQGPDPETSKHLYRELGRYIKGGSGAVLGRRRLVALAAIVLVAMAGVFAYTQRPAPESSVDPDEPRKLSRLPPLFRGDGSDPAESEVRLGTMVEATAGAPVRIHTRVRENSVLVKGKYKPVELRFSKDTPVTAELTGEFIAGSIETDFPRGVARVLVEGARTTVEVVKGRAIFDMKENTFRLAVHAGVARIMRGPILMKTLHAGQGGEFLDGNPMGRIEEFGVSGEN